MSNDPITEAQAAVDAVEARFDDPAAGGPNFAVLAHQLAEATKALLTLARDAKEQWDYVAIAIGAQDPDNPENVIERAETIRDAPTARLQCEPEDRSVGISESWWLAGVDDRNPLDLRDTDSGKAVGLVPLPGT